MATSTVRTNLNAVNLANNESLEYTLKPSGARANFAWSDDQPTTPLTHLDFPMANQLVGI